MAGDLAKSGLHTSIWTTARRPVDEANLYKFVQLATHPWFDERLQRVCKVTRRLVAFSFCACRNLQSAADGIITIQRPVFSAAAAGNMLRFSQSLTVLTTVPLYQSPLQSIHLGEEDVMEMREFYDEVIAGRRVTVVRASEVFKKLVSTHWVCVLWATGGVLRQGGTFGGWCRDVVVRFTLLFLRLDATVGTGLSLHPALAVGISGCQAGEQERHYLLGIRAHGVLLRNAGQQGADEVPVPGRGHRQPAVLDVSSQLFCRLTSPAPVARVLCVGLQ
jgi:hypothetical protein